MRKIALLGLLFLFSIGSLAQETKVIKDGKKVTKEQVEKNKKKFEKKIKEAKKKEASTKKDTKKR
jgi:colicin import membrane protein